MEGAQQNDSQKMQDLKKYVFFGKILPERTNVSIFPLGIGIDFPDSNIKGTIKFSVQLSQIYAEFISEKEVDNIATLKNYIEKAIRAPIDTLGYVLGCGYDVEITSVITDSGNQIVWGVGISDNIEEFKKKRPKDFPEIVKLYSDKNGQYLQRCFSNLREAIRNSEDAGFFCYRGIESLAQFFADKHNLDKEKQKKEVWTKFRESLGIQRDKIDFIQKFSDPVRHGDTVYISSENMKIILETTWEIVDKYIVFAGNGYK